MPDAAPVLRYSAFTDTPDGGNPAGVVLDARDMADARMLALAAEIGYSETAFITPRTGGRATGWTRSASGPPGAPPEPRPAGCA